MMQKYGWSKNIVRIAILIMIVFLTTSIIHSATLSILDRKLRNRINEVDVWKSNIDTSSTSFWINLAQQRIVTLSGYLPNFVDFPYISGDSNFFRLPADYRIPKKVLVKSDGRFYPVLSNPGLSRDTSLLTYDVLWSNPDSAHIILNRGGFRDKQVDIIFNSDSSTYRLPSDFHNLIGVIGWSSTWAKVTYSPMFLLDSTRLYDIHRKHPDTALLYLRGNFIDNDTVRVFYWKALETNDTIRVEYRGTATDMAAGTECELPDDLEGYVIEEALGYYFLYMKDVAAAERIWQQVRIDMGLIQPGGQQ